MTVESQRAFRLLAEWRDQDAFMLFENTYGLGAGLGSSRHSSLIMTLLSTVASLEQPLCDGVL